MATGRVPTTANSPLTAKGDLFGYSTTQARVPVGSNGETLVADSSASTGLRWQTAANGNFLINGSHDIWQRGTSFACSTATYTADRWQGFRSGSPGVTVSRQNVNDTTNLPFLKYCSRVQRDSGDTGTNLIYYTNSLESQDTVLLQGQTATLSFYARAGANYSSSSNVLTATIAQGTGIDQNICNGYTGQGNVVQSNVTLTTTWQRFSITGTVSTIATQLGVYFNYTPTGTAGTNDYFEITGVQLERGSVATSFKRAAGTLAGELAACQRYYQRYESSASYAPFGTGYVFSTTQTIHSLPFQVRLRGNPSVSFSAGNTFAAYTALGTVTAATGTGTDRVGTNSLMFSLTAATGVANGQGCFCIANAGAAAYIEVNSEL